MVCRWASRLSHSGQGPALGVRRPAGADLRLRRRAGTVSFSAEKETGLASSSEQISLRSVPLRGTSAPLHLFFLSSQKLRFCGAPEGAGLRSRLWTYTAADIFRMNMGTPSGPYGLSLRRGDGSVVLSARRLIVLLAWQCARRGFCGLARLCAGLPGGQCGMRTEGGGRPLLRPRRSSVVTPRRPASTSWVKCCSWRRARSRAETPAKSISLLPPPVAAA